MWAPIADQIHIHIASKLYIISTVWTIVVIYIVFFSIECQMAMNARGQYSWSNQQNAQCLLYNVFWCVVTIGHYIQKPSAPQCLSSVTTQITPSTIMACRNELLPCLSSTGIGIQVHPSHLHLRVWHPTRRRLSLPSQHIHWDSMCRSKQHPITILNIMSWPVYWPTRFRTPSYVSTRVYTVSTRYYSGQDWESMQRGAQERLKLHLESSTLVPIGVWRQDVRCCGRPSPCNIH